MKKLLLLSLTILLFSCGDNTERIIEEECEVCWEFIDVVTEIEQFSNPMAADRITYTVTAENTCIGEQKTGVREVRGYNEPFVYVGNVLCEGLFQDWYTFE